MKKLNLYNTFIGNLFTVKDGVGTVSDTKYVVVKEFGKYYAYPDRIRTLVGCYEITKDSTGINYLINAKRLYEVTDKKKVTKDDIDELISSCEESCRLRKTR